MKKPWTAGAAVLIGTLVALGYFASPAQYQSPASSGDEAAIRSTVEGLGAQLKLVSLLAPDVAGQISAHYTPYLTPELLAKWHTDPASAPGRTTSSPWPDRIEITSIEQIGEGSMYHVEAQVIEVANSEVPGAFVSSYPVELTLEQRGGGWLISEWQKGALQEPAERISATGYWECLPHKDTSGPQTLECAFGIAIDQSDGHYGINTSLMSTYPVDFPTGTKVRVEGRLEPAPADTNYNIDGVIWAASIDKL